MKHKGFTLIELAIVIAIVAILAAVAIPRFTDVSAQAEEAMVDDFLAQLQSASAMYTARMRTPPTGFNTFVSAAQTLPTTPTGTGPGAVFPTLTVFNFGSNARNGTRCTVAATTITCGAGVFNNGTATYGFNGGAFTVTKTGFGATTG